MPACCTPSFQKTFGGRVALITGASSGFGAEFARQLAPFASTLILVARREERLEALRLELLRPGLVVECHALDLAERGELDGFLQQLASRSPAVDLVINNAGLGDHGFFDSSAWERCEAMLEVNIRALTRITHAIVPQMVRAGGGSILNVSSVASLLPVPELTVYAATKAFVTSFTEGLRAELRGTGVGVSALCPGPVETEFSQVAGRAGEVDSMQSPGFIRIPARQVVHEGLQALAWDRARMIPGWIVWAVFMVLSVLPIALLRVGMSQRFKRSVR